MSGCREQMGGRAGRPDTRLAGQTGGQTPCLPPASPPPPLVLLHRVLGGTDGAGSGVPPQCPPFPKPAWALAAYARAQEDLVGEAAGGGHLPVGAGCPCGGPWGSARGAGAGPCPDSKAGCLSAASLAPHLIQAPCCSPAPPPILGCLLPLQPSKRSPLAAPLGASGPWGASRPVSARSGVLEPSSPAS